MKSPPSRRRQLRDGFHVRVQGEPGHFDGVRPHTLEEWQRLGEAGQLLAGVFAGYTLAEIAAKREWSADEARGYLAMVQGVLGSAREGRETMPAVSDKQRKFMGAELARKRAGKKTQTGMSAEQLEDFAKKGKKKAAPKRPGY